MNADLTALKDRTRIISAHYWPEEPFQKVPEREYFHWLEREGMAQRRETMLVFRETDWLIVQPQELKEVIHCCPSPRLA